MDERPDVQVEKLAGRQAGCIGRAQALEAGFSDDKIGHRLRSNRWRRAHAGVYVLAAVPPSWEQAVWGAVLAASRRTAVIREVTVTHASALLLQGVDPSWLPRYPITLTVPNGRHCRVAGAVVHQIDDLVPHHLTELDGLPMTRPARSIVDLAASLGQRHLGDILDDLIVARRTTPAAVATCLAEVARPGKRGITKLGRVLDGRGPGHVPPQSELERLLLEALARAGLPEPVRQFPLPGQRPGDEFADAAYPDAKVLLEADGRRWHTRIRDIRRDHARDAETSRAGWLTLRFTHEELTTAPSDVATTVADVRSTRLVQLSSQGVIP